MVQNPRAPVGADALHLLNLPAPIEVRASEGGTPLQVKLKERWLLVRQVLERWRIDDEWWREQPISRMYFRVVLEDGQHATLFHDLLKGSWHRQGQGGQPSAPTTRHPWEEARLAGLSFGRLRT